jgi:hypothetical protein
VAGYGLIASHATVQVLSPTVVNDVVYCTIQTNPSGVIASIPVQQDVFDSGTAGPELTALSDAIEQIMNDANVIAGVGAQTIDANGLLADQVAFTVEYVAPGSSGTSVTAEALVPVTMLNFTDALIGQTSLGNVQAIIDATYQNLVSAAGSGSTGTSGAAPKAPPPAANPSGG